MIYISFYNSDRQGAETISAMFQVEARQIIYVYDCAPTLGKPHILMNRKCRRCLIFELLTLLTLTKLSLSSVKAHNSNIEEISSNHVGD